MKHGKILLSMILILCLAVQVYALPEPDSPSIVSTDPAIKEMEQALQGLSNPDQSAKGKPPASSSLSNQAGQSAFPNYMAKANDFLNGAAANNYYAVTVPDFINRTKIDTNWVIVDIRPADAYAQGHIGNAINVPASNLISLMGTTVPAGKRVAVCGTTNTDAAFGAMALSIFGNREAYVLLDGLSAWQASGMPVVA